MTEQKAFKKRVRNRMAETGERYTTARAKLVGAEGRVSNPTLQPHVPIADIVLGQLETMESIGLPALAGTTGDIVRQRVATIVHSGSVPDSVIPSDRIPVLLVLPGLDTERAMPLTSQGTKSGYVDMRPVTPDGFMPLPGVRLPDGPYLLIDIDTGRDTLGLAPRSAATQIADAGRSPLTLEEGVTLLALNPGILRARNCFQMLGSRRNDKRIASLWVTKQGNPRLGWCYEGVPHAWLGSASCAARIG